MIIGRALPSAGGTSWVARGSSSEDLMAIVRSLPWGCIHAPGLRTEAGRGSITEVNRRALDHVPPFVDEKAEAPVLRKGRQPVPAIRR